ncbi:DUF3592 domain-containing protein [Candidatus Uhrbacteria bacterium]|nr:DUF3592 domain-containing protein [Candidatus Uhrbacteria bacterium]
MANKFVFYLFSVVGIVALVGTGYWINHELSFINRSQKSQGMVLEMVRRVSTSKKSADTFAPRIKFTLPDGSSQEFTSTLSSSWKFYRVGQKVDVLYDPAQPDTAEINSFFALWVGPCILGFLGLTFSSIGIGSVVWAWRRRRYCAELMQRGVKITAIGGRIERDCTVRVNRQCAWRIVCEAEYNGERRTFKSDRLWKDPTDAVRDKQVTIAIDPADPKKYCVDTSFLS